MRLRSRREFLERRLILPATCVQPPSTDVVAHWSDPNPADARPADLDAFRATAKELHKRVRYLLPLLGLSDRSAFGKAPGCT
jgi:hypothetical protein